MGALHAFLKVAWKMKMACTAQSLPDTGPEQPTCHPALAVAEQSQPEQLAASSTDGGAEDTTANAAPGD